MNNFRFQRFIKDSSNNCIHLTAYEAEKVDAVFVVDILAKELHQGLLLLLLILNHPVSEVVEDDGGVLFCLVMLVLMVEMMAGFGPVMMMTRLSTFSS